MSWHIVSWLLIAGGFLSALVFVLAFWFAFREAAAASAGPRGDLPTASLHQARVFSNNPWHRGMARERLIQGVHLAQSGLVAFGITAVFVMLMCMAAIFMAMLVSCL